MIDPIEVIDSHTAGEPTRVVVAGGPPLGVGSIEGRCQRLARDFDHFRKAVVTEPRGHEVLVGALLCEPADESHVAGVIFFNNVGYLGMCGHGMIGVVQTLRYLGRIGAGVHTIETPVGPVVGELHSDGSVSIRNVESYRSDADVALDVPGVGQIRGDVAWGGNWFFLTADIGEPLRFDHVRRLCEIATAIRQSVNQSGYPQVDHVELFCDSDDGFADAKNFVLCPGLEFDRSPCGTGTSAKLACLAADGKLQPGQIWTQQGILGTTFQSYYGWVDANQQRIVPTVRGTAFVTGETRLRFDAADPFAFGLAGGIEGEAIETHKKRW